MYIASAPGKVILHGEHSVVYGKTALASSISLRAYICIRKSSDALWLNFEDVGVKESWELAELQEIFDTFSFTTTDVYITDVVTPSQESVERIKEFVTLRPNLQTYQVQALMCSLVIYLSLHKAAGVPLRGMKINAVTEIPVGAGLGSSASLSVALVTAILRMMGILGGSDLSDDNKTFINQWALVGEKIIHGNPSGVDNYVSAMGGTISFRRGDIETAQWFPALRVLIVNTNISRQTKQLVAKVKKNVEKYPDIFEPVINSIDAVVDVVKTSYQKLAASRCKQTDEEVSKEIKEMVFTNHNLLKALGVSHDVIEEVVTLAENCGMASKLTGAGGGGCVLCWITQDISDKSVLKLKQTLEDRGFNVWESVLGGGGVSLSPEDTPFLGLPAKVAEYFKRL